MRNKDIPPSKKTCFIIMPITDPEGYDQGHFGRIYEHLVKPACIEEGLHPLRADDVRATNYIVLDILQKIISSDLVLCDLSSRNPNVLYELGIRQAFNLPVVLIKDRRTERIFDIQGIRTLEYDDTLRIDSVKRDVNNLRTALTATLEQPKSDVNSLIKLLSVPKAELRSGSDISSETALIMSSLRDIGQRLTHLEETSVTYSRSPIRRIQKQNIGLRLPNGEEVTTGEEIFENPGGHSLGKFVDIERDGIVVRRQDGEIYLIPSDDERYETLSTIPF